jgi:hypothetical protein
MPTHIGYQGPCLAVSYAKSRLQKKTANGWSTIARTMTDGEGHGRYSIAWKDRRRRSVRLVAASLGPFCKSVSRTIVIY